MWTERGEEMGRETWGDGGIEDEGVGDGKGGRLSGMIVGMFFHSTCLQLSFGRRRNFLRAAVSTMLDLFVIMISMPFQ